MYSDKENSSGYFCGLPRDLPRDMPRDLACFAMLLLEVASSIQVC